MKLVCMVAVLSALAITQVAAQPIKDPMPEAGTPAYAAWLHRAIERGAASGIGTPAYFERVERERREGIERENKRFLEQAAANEATRVSRESARLDADAKGGWRRISLLDLAVDKKTIPASQKLSVEGLYQRIGSSEWLVTMPGNTNTQSIGLVTDKASRDARLALERCGVGMCGIRLGGVLVTCQHQFAGRAYRSDLCLSVIELR